MISHLLSLERIIVHDSISNKKRALETLSRCLANNQPSLNVTTIFNKLMEREDSGSTGFGKGVALPHCRLNDLPQATLALMTLTTPLDFNALDDQPVDLLFALAVPEQGTDIHLQILAQLAQLLSNKTLCLNLRKATHPQTLLDLIHAWEADQTLQDISA
ncbi:MAG: PTS sugar transporter subunit IIA [Gammaproteobacteria bacterium]|nr:PTS sugar transporter subunit IIA [Gammaproteobacteria bacterium]